MKTIIDAVMGADSAVVAMVDDTLLRNSVPLEQSRFVREVICRGIDDPRKMLITLRVMSMMPVSDLVALLEPIYEVHQNTLCAIFSIDDEKSRANFNRVIRSLNGNRLVSNSLNEKALMNLKKALRRDNE